MNWGRYVKPREHFERDQEDETFLSRQHDYVCEFVKSGRIYPSKYDWASSEKDSCSEIFDFCSGWFRMMTFTMFK